LEIDLVAHSFLRITVEFFPAILGKCSHIEKGISPEAPK